MMTGLLRAGIAAVLRDGGRVVVRPIEPSDEGPILEFLDGLSVHSRYLRFFSMSPDLARNAHSSVLKRSDRYGLVATLPDSPEIIGHTGYWLLRDRCAELALAVADRCQGRGLGRVLLDAIAEAAARHGLRALEMEVLPNNLAVLRLLGGCRWRVSAQLLSGVIVCELHLTPVGPVTVQG